MIQPISFPLLGTGLPERVQAIVRHDGRIAGWGLHLSLKDLTFYDKPVSSR